MKSSKSTKSAKAQKSNTVKTNKKEKNVAATKKSDKKADTKKVNKKADTKKTKTTITNDAIKRGPGRPKTKQDTTATETKRGPGRPKTKPDTTQAASTEDKKRGRPKTKPVKLNKTEQKFHEVLTTINFKRRADLTMKELMLANQFLTNRKFGSVNIDLTKGKVSVKLSKTGNQLLGELTAKGAAPNGKALKAA
jgi:hypothetical protein